MKKIESSPVIIIPSSYLSWKKLAPKDVGKFIILISILKAIHVDETRCKGECGNDVFVKCAIRFLDAPFRVEVKSFILIFYIYF